MKIFISYSHRDSDFAYPLAERLRRSHLVWIDTELIPGDNWWNQIVDSISLCDCFISLLSPYSADSIYCNAERNFALNLDVTLVSIVLEQADLSPISHLQMVDLRSFKSEPLEIRIEQAIAKLALIPDSTVLKRKAHQKAIILPSRPLPRDDRQVLDQLDLAEWAVSQCKWDMAKQLFTEVLEMGGLPEIIRSSANIGLRHAHQYEHYDAITEALENWDTLDKAKRKLEKYRQIYGNDYDPLAYLSDPEFAQFPIKPEQYQIVRIIQNPKKSLEDRLAAAAKLAYMGDPRPGVTINSKHLPDISWIELPVLPNGSKILIAKYPITNIQFECFMADESSGYDFPDWWHGELHKPSSSVSPKLILKNAPRTFVNWHEAVAFCRWLSHKLQMDITLPTREEWIHAAQSLRFPLPNNKYPPGSSNLSDADDSTVVYNREKVVPVGMYPNRRAANGIVDLCGNVWEWTLSKNEKGQRLVLGGTWHNNIHLEEATYSLPLSPRERRSNIGFRVIRHLTG